MASNSPPDQDENSQQQGYEQRHPRINKPDMFMNIALWMEMSTLAECPDNFGAVSRSSVQHGDVQDESQSKFQGKPVQQETCRSSLDKVHKAGAVVVLPNDRALSVDCSQDGVHAAVSALNKFGQERVKGCQVYLSRRPCSFCTKLLVQCEVSKVFYLPTEPECKDPEDVRIVDNIFKASSTGLSIFIPRVRENVIEELKNPHDSPFARGRINEEAVTAFRRKLDECYWSDEWINDANIVLEWPAFSDKMKEQTITDMKNLMEWIARATLADVPEDVVFAEIDPGTLREKPVNIPTGEEEEERIGGGMKENIPSIPTTTDPNWQKHALHMCRLAQMLSQRSDDPTKRVGCVLMIHNEVVAIGWNGFPAKALYGEFPRASNTDEAREKKEPYVIHAEHNALLTRNKRNLKDDSSILFSNKIPAPQCVPMLVAAGVKNVVVPHEPTDDPENQAFFNALKSGKLVGYWPKEPPNLPRRNLNADFD